MKLVTKCKYMNNREIIHHPVIEPFGGWDDESVEKVINKIPKKNRKDSYCYLVERWTQYDRHFIKTSEVICEKY